MLTLGVLKARENRACGEIITQCSRTLVHDLKLNKLNVQQPVRTTLLICLKAAKGSVEIRSRAETLVSRVVIHTWVSSLQTFLAQNI